MLETGEVVFNNNGGTAGGLLLKYTPDGVRLWYRNIEPDDGLYLPFGLEADGSGHIYLGFAHVGPALIGDSVSTQFFQPEDGILKSSVARFTPNGQCQWAKAFFCTDAALAVAPDGDAYLSAALFRDEVYLSENYALQAPGANTTSLWFKLSAAGQALWGKLPANADEPMSNTNHNITIDEEEYLYATATFNSSLDFGDGWVLNTGYDSPDYDALYFAKFSNTATTAVPAGPLVRPLKAYPNPAGEWVILHLPEAAVVEWWSLQGQLVSQLQLGEGEQQLPLGRLPAGHYLLRATGAKGVYACRIVVQE